MTTFIILVTLIALVGIGGAFAKPTWLRVILWILSLPPLGVGLFALWQGGIAETFPPVVMWIFCAITFWPFIGCTLGEAFRLWPKSPKTN